MVPNCLHWRRDSAHLGDRKCIYHFTLLAQRTVVDLVLIIDFVDNNTQRGCVMSLSILDVNMILVPSIAKYFFPEI